MKLTETLLSIILNVILITQTHYLLNNTEDKYDIIPLSTYTDVDTLAERMFANNSILSISSLNAQSM